VRRHRFSLPLQDVASDLARNALSLELIELEVVAHASPIATRADEA
jgi:hypothetical protein